MEVKDQLTKPAAPGGATANYLPSPSTDAKPRRPAAADVLTEARKLIEDPADWTQGEESDGNGRRCAIRALADANGSDELLALTRPPSYRHLKAAMGDRMISAFNDSHSHAEVLAAFDRAIYLALEFGE